MRTRMLSLVLAVGCADEPVDLEGVYRVTSLVASAPCGLDQPVDDPPAYVKFTKENFFGETYYSYASCTTESATDCTELGDLIGGFTEPRDDGWGGYVASTSSSGDQCILGYSQQAAVLDRDTRTTLTIETSEHAEEQVLSESACTTALAQQRGTDMPCLAHAIWTAER